MTKWWNFCNSLPLLWIKLKLNDDRDLLMSAAVYDMVTASTDFDES